MAAGPFTAGFGFKTSNDSFYHSRLLEPTQKAPFTVIFKLKPTVTCRCFSHANSAPMTTTVETLLPPTLTTLVQK